MLVEGLLPIAQDGLQLFRAAPLGRKPCINIPDFHVDDAAVMPGGADFRRRLVRDRRASQGQQAGLLTIGRIRRSGGSGSIRYAHRA